MLEVITLYSTGCPRCNVLKQKLNAANIQYDEVSDVEAILRSGIDTVPVLEVDGVKMDYATADKWMKEKTYLNEKQ